MTNIFGLNITDDKENNKFDGEVFCTKSIDVSTNSEVLDIVANEAEFEQKGSLSLPLSVIKTICGLGWFIIAVGIIGSLGDISLAQGFKNAPGMFIAFPLLFAVWLVLHIISVRRRKDMENSAEFQQHNDNAEQLLQKIKTEFGIPGDAKDIDVLAERYVVRDNKPKLKEFGLTQYNNYSMFTYIKDGCLCLADAYSVWEIPVISVRSIELVKKRVSFPDWTKPEPYDSAKYKPFKITTNQFGHYFSRYYRVEIIDAKGEFYLLIPEYDGEPFMELTHQKPYIQ